MDQEAPHGHRTPQDPESDGVDQILPEVEEHHTPVQEDSAGTLVEKSREATTLSTAHIKIDPEAPYSAPVRPSTKRRWETELPKTVSRRPVIPEVQHKSSGATYATNFAASKAADLSSDSSSEWSEEEDIVALHRSQTEPQHNALSAHRLNRIRNKPNRVPQGKDSRYGRFKVSNQHFTSLGRVANDGRLTISVNDTANSGYLAKALGKTIDRQLHATPTQAAQDDERIRNQDLQTQGLLRVPRLNIVIMVIGSRGDIQPFLKIGKVLQENHGHRVRIATHPVFRKFVEEEMGLEFFSIGGDPAELMTFMVKNPGLLPSFETIKAGEIGRRREAMYDMMCSMWRACINHTDGTHDGADLKVLGDRPPFVADAIIANPPSFAHYHCAEKLGCPLHLVFTFPYSPTQSFPHPLANIKTSNVDQSYTNYMSYPLVDLMVWQGLGDLVNRFRVSIIGLEPVSTLWAPGQISRLRVPTTYLWSKELVPKPADWGPEIDIAGYVFLDQASTYSPPDDLSQFLDRSDDRPIVYIGFGSIAGIDDLTAFTKMIFEGVAKANVKAVISRGWGGMGDGLEKPDGVFMLDVVPHDWLFPKVDAVVHHGGAGTTAAGLRFGKPTMIVPFFGDQPFWSAMIARAGAGAKKALPLRKLDSEKFAEGIKQCLKPEAKERAQEIANSIAKEGDGAENAVESFHRSLPLDGLTSMRCSIFEDRVAAWRVKHTHLRLSALAADLLVQNNQLRWSDMNLIRHRDWHDFSGPGEPITGAGGVLLSAFQEAFQGLQSIPENTKRDMRRHEKAKRKQKGITIENAITLPGKIAQATKGIPSSGSPEDYEKFVRANNLYGKAEPLKHKHPKSRRTGVEGQGLTRVSSLDPAALIVAKDVSKGFGRSTKAVVRMPWDLWYATTLGFRNAPRLYGDKTVRPLPGQITGFQSGVKIAGTEFYHGFYDGLTGLVTIPVQETRADGITGLPKGVARGVGGLVLKPIAGTMGVPAYTSRGLWRSMRKPFRDTTRTERWLRRARIDQGIRDVEEIQGKRDKTNPSSHEHESDLEDVRSTALKRWNTDQQKQVAKARERDENPVTHAKSRVKFTKTRGRIL